VRGKKTVNWKANCYVKENSYHSNAKEQVNCYAKAKSLEKYAQAVS
jgi:hypothetical protein